MAATGKVLDARPIKQRNSVISRRSVVFMSLIAVSVLIAIAIVYWLRGSQVERGTSALIEAFSKRRLIEPRLSGGFKCGQFNPASDDHSGVETHELDKAKDLITEAAGRGEPGGQLAYARFLLSGNDRLPEAAKYLRRVLTSTPDSPEEHNDLGVCLILQGKLEDALDQFESALEREADMPEALFNRGLCYERLLLRDAAGGDYSRLLEVE